MLDRKKETQSQIKRERRGKRENDKEIIEREHV
jgi:hypothetical protein